MVEKTTTSMRLTACGVTRRIEKKWFRILRKALFLKVRYFHAWSTNHLKAIFKAQLKQKGPVSHTSGRIKPFNVALNGASDAANS